MHHASRLSIVAASDLARRNHVSCTASSASALDPSSRVAMARRRGRASSKRSASSSSSMRVAQLHDFALPMVKVLSKMRIAPRGLRFESVGVDEVAARLAELTLGAPAGRVVDLAGPQMREIGDMVRAFDGARGRVHRLLPIRLPGAIGRVYRPVTTSPTKPRRGGRRPGRNISRTARCRFRRWPDQAVAGHRSAHPRNTTGHLNAGSVMTHRHCGLLRCGPFGLTQPSRRLTISPIQLGANGEVQPGAVG